jgi:hypothetical protein
MHFLFESDISFLSYTILKGPLAWLPHVVFSPCTNEGRFQPIQFRNKNARLQCSLRHNSFLSVQVLFESDASFVELCILKGIKFRNSYVAAAFQFKHASSTWIQQSWSYGFQVVLIQSDSLPCRTIVAFARFWPDRRC